MTPTHACPYLLLSEPSPPALCLTDSSLRPFSVCGCHAWHCYLQVNSCGPIFTNMQRAQKAGATYWGSHSRVSFQAGAPAPDSPPADPGCPFCQAGLLPLAQTPVRVLCLCSWTSDQLPILGSALMPSRLRCVWGRGKGSMVAALGCMFWNWNWRGWKQ